MMIAYYIPRQSNKTFNKINIDIIRVAKNDNITTLRFVNIENFPVKYRNTDTIIKPPGIKVGIIDPDGILNGSTKNERRRKTTRITGKKLREYSTIMGSCSLGARFFLNIKESKSQIAPVTISAMIMNRAKSMSTPRVIYQPAKPRERLPEEFPHYRPVSSVFCRLSVFQEVYVYV